MQRVFAQNFKPLNKSFVYKGVSCTTIFNHHIRWLNTDLFYRASIAHRLHRSILIDTRATHIQPVPMHASWADSFKCNYFNRPSSKPSNFRRIFCLFSIWFDSQGDAWATWGIGNLNAFFEHFSTISCTSCNFWWIIWLWHFCHY